MITKKKILVFTLHIIMCIFLIESARRLGSYYNLDLFTVGFFTWGIIDVIWNILDYFFDDDKKCNSYSCNK